MRITQHLKAIAKTSAMIALKLFSQPLTNSQPKLGKQVKYLSRSSTMKAVYMT